MSNEPTDKPGTQNSADSDASIAARRKLLKAAAAAPVVATLHPGAAMATASAFQCIPNTDQMSMKKFVTNGNSMNGDNAVRREVNYYYRTATQANGNIYPKKLYADQLYAGTPAVLYDQDGGTHNVIGNGTSDAENITSEDLTNMYDGSVTAFVLVMYQPNGSNTGVTELGTWPKVQMNSGAQPLNGTCLCSVDPNQPICPI